ncbi:aminomethyl-transferring glycine dehydrogenase [Catenovulum adriaticum]|uniref:Glycine dehydrogenase (decarboxylating) n=1 Tax=Catenovulum adriaticum TaxID=2984846 RepID=A0ABY7AL22_9ALTE|nr:aminomethyl-transferring glycine dehydrogenase [Catenovulum sp. TS8]WAJ69160.1 aminomethyl-transferring glycine dehydrogenase [Catenovulum sp. TS8]
MNDNLSLLQLEQRDDFIQRHIGPDEAEQQHMLATLGLTSLDELITQTVPKNILLEQAMQLGDAQTEVDTLAQLKKMANQNQVFNSYIGMGYYPNFTPNVILRNVLENPGWYTAYTPYQPEIAQGRLESLLNYQQMVIDLTGMEIANASLLDESTAAAEAMAMAKRMSKNKKSNLFFIADDVHPQTINVTKTRAELFGFEVIVAPADEVVNQDVFGALFQYPNTTGNIYSIETLIQSVADRKGVTAVATDLLALTQLKTPAELGADIVLGSAQRFGVPMGYGGPHAAFFATKDKFKRSLPGRIIGVSKDKRGKLALRMALQTREQHIRREKANSNICTAQVLLANMAAFYAIYHGPKGLDMIAKRTQRLASMFALGLKAKGVELASAYFFDTVCFKTDAKTQIIDKANAAEINLRSDLDNAIAVSFDETKTQADLAQLFSVILGDEHGLDLAELDKQATEYQAIPDNLQRESDYLSHPVFNTHHSETEMLRYIKSLENKDLALNHSMISLGSCTMKLNATAEMIPVSWPEFANLHPFSPIEQAQGYKQMITQLEKWLVEITGYDAMCMQPNSGAQGEYAGLLAIRKYHESRGDSHRNICLIPSSAHGTNPASAQMASMKVVVVACDEKGNVDMQDLKQKAADVAENLSCIMITYPSTHGVYEQTIREICDIVHQHGGQVYMDGANMNAQVGITSPGFIGSDVSHLNLHKTFCIPHGGGGPGMGPIGVKSHLAPFLPDHPVVNVVKENADNGAVSAAPWGSASILPISWVYIALMGAKGLRKATEVAILNANYIATKLADHYPILYRGQNSRVAHECIIDLRPLKASSGITEMDVAKRLMDYGFHAPTMSFPVAGTLMVEPTESEPLVEIDRFIDAMIAIREEIDQVEKGVWALDNNPLVNAPHTMTDLVDENWNRAYSRELAVFPSPAAAANKFWPTVNRIDDVYGDRNLICSCPSIESYVE